MTMSYDHLLGLPFTHGSQDCFGLVRRFYADSFGLKLDDFARPDNWWDQGLNLYMDNFSSQGFELIHVHPREIQIGDAFLMAVRSRVPNHAAVYVGDGQILHHVYGRFSATENYAGLWQKVTCAHLRHPAVFSSVEETHTKTMTKIDLMNLLPPGMKQLLGDAYETLRASDQS
jgi:cell wall-associated NlpC family hydrolase